MKIPFSRQTGEMLMCSPVGGVHMFPSPTEWKDNYEFEDELKYSSCSKPGTSIYIFLKSTTSGKEYRVFTNIFFDELLIRPDIKPGPTWKGKWTFTRKGYHYSIKPI